MTNEWHTFSAANLLASSNEFFKWAVDAFLLNSARGFGSVGLYIEGLVSPTETDHTFHWPLRVILTTLVCIDNVHSNECLRFKCIRSLAKFLLERLQFLLQPSCLLVIFALHKDQRSKIKWNLEMMILTFFRLTLVSMSVCTPVRDITEQFTADYRI